MQTPRMVLGLKSKEKSASNRIMYLSMMYSVVCAASRKDTIDKNSERRAVRNGTQHSLQPVPHSAPISMS
jgi:hypothetical protein